MPRTDRKTTALAQGAYFVATGVFPFVSRRAFEAVTGPKEEWWLVQTVGAAVTVAGAALLSAAAHDRVTPEIELLGAGTAAVLGGIETFHAARGRIAPSYLLDAALEAGFIAGWAAARRG